MFTYQERETILHTLIHQFQKRSEITAIILVGSSSYGFKDDYSDIDIAIVHDGKNDIAALFQKTFSDIASQYDIAIRLDQQERNLQIFLLDHYLELDIGYYTLHSLYARRGEYQVVYDKSNSVQAIMDKSWIDNQTKNMGTTANVNMENELCRIDSTFWYNLLHAVLAFNRNEVYRCYFELEELRTAIISLVGKRNRLESKRFRHIHQLSESEKEKVNALFCYPKSKEELKSLLLNMLNLLYAEYAYWKKQNICYEPKVDETFLRKYVSDLL